MSLKNNTKNQHFIPQVEQRLNAIDPTLASENQHIYEFEVLSHALDGPQLGSPQRRRIERNLSIHDLFSFDVIPETDLRLNFESLFQRYEGDVERNTRSLLEKVRAGNQDIGAEVVDLFASKVMNFARNPYSIEKMLNTFGIFGDHVPLEPDVAKLFESVLNGRRPHQKYRCAELGITEGDYARWLRTLFMMLCPVQSGTPSLYDQALKTLFQSNDLVVGAMVCTYSSESCLLSDRSWSTNVSATDADGYDFNLTQHAFIRYIVMNRLSCLPPNTPQHLVTQAKAMKLPINVHHRHDDMELLRIFNLNAIIQSESRVFCAVKDGIKF